PSVSRLVTAAGARLRRLAGDLGSGRRHGEPPAAECVDPLTVDLTGLLVALIAIERVAVVRDLRLAVGSLDGSEHLGIGSGSVSRLSAHPKGRPRSRAGTGAGALVLRVLLEQVERAALRVDEDLAETGVGDPDRGGRSVRGLWWRNRCCCATTVTTTCRDGQCCEHRDCR